MRSIWSYAIVCNTIICLWPNTCASYEDGPASSIKYIDGMSSGVTTSKL